MDSMNGITEHTDFVGADIEDPIMSNLNLSAGMQGIMRNCSDKLNTR